MDECDLTEKTTQKLVGGRKVTAASQSRTLLQATQGEMQSPVLRMQKPVRHKLWSMQHRVVLMIDAEDSLARPHLTQPS